MLSHHRIFNSQPLIVEHNEADRANLSKRLEIFREIPPIYLPEIHTAWQLPCTGSHAANAPLLRTPPQNFDGDYGYIRYVALK